MQTKRFSKVGQLLRLLTAILLLGSWCAFGHGVEVPQPAAADLAQVRPELSNSLEFAESLLMHWRGRCDAQQLAALDKIGDLMERLSLIQNVQARNVGPRDAAFCRWLVETNLLGLVNDLNGVVSVDFRRGAARTNSPPLDLNQQFNLVLLKVVTGNGPVGFGVQTMNLTSERDPENYTVNVASNGTTFTLLKLEQVPSDQTILHVRFRPEGAVAPTLLHTLSWKARPLGQLAVKVLDEDGQPAPVLLRLASGEGQRLFEPPNAVDLSALMNDVTRLPIYGPGRGYMVYIPGPFRGRYWLVPRLFEMGVPPGPWEIHIMRGAETIPIHDTLRVEPGQWTRKTYQLKRWVNMPSLGWYSGDDHVHSRLMSSDDAEKLLAFARAGDIHVANILEMGNEMRTWYAQRGFGPEFRVSAGNHWLVPGQEDPRSMLGHAIGLNLRAKVRDLDHYYLNDWVAGEIHQQGGLYGHTHVGNSEVKSLFTERQMALFTPMGIVDFNSILQNKLGLDLYYDFLNLGFKMTASSGTDTPYGGTVGAVRVYAFCGTNQPFNPDRWFAALKRGNTFVTTGPMLDFKVEDALPGDEITLTNQPTAKVKLRAWGLRGASAPMKLQLVQFGKPIQELTADSAEQDLLEIETTVSAGQSCWLAAYAKGRDGSEAHTTPVYLVRPGERSWDVSDAAKLIAKQLAVLDEIEQAVGESERYMHGGNRPDEYWNRWPALQAEQIRARVHQTRRQYQDLLHRLPAR
jgi:hypothetical protein